MQAILFIREAVDEGNPKNGWDVPDDPGGIMT